MRVSLSWLNELVQVNEPVDQLAHRLSMAGFEEEEIDDLSAMAQGVVVGYVKEREKHPNADKLSVCRVDVGGLSRFRSRVEPAMCGPASMCLWPWWAPSSQP